ncbi:MAG: hypothetical protein KAX05_03415 [Bacteroidales bacterium]|nr:hypothetical protein [Bacteroidales bacterium]
MKRKDLRKLANNIYRSTGDALAGERIIAQARSIGDVCIVSGTSSHRVQQTVLKKNALCVIDKEFRLSDTEMRLKLK